MSVRFGVMSEATWEKYLVKLKLYESDREPYIPAQFTPSCPKHCTWGMPSNIWSMVSFPFM
jgi:hypothetical protein